MNRKEIRDRLEGLADPAYREFHMRLVPGLTDMLGVRSPALRALAKEVAAGDWESYLSQEACHDTYEETMLHGMVIGAAKLPLSRRLTEIKAFVPVISNWALCDGFVSSLRFRAGEMDALWEFLAPYLLSQLEFPARFGAVMLLRFYVRQDCINRTIHALAGIPAPGYNARMGVAWALSTCYIKFPAPTMAVLQAAALDDWTYNKTLQKILESKRVTAEDREALRRMKR